jgi:hypothetical protein
MRDFSAAISTESDGLSGMRIVAEESTNRSLGGLYWRPVLVRATRDAIEILGTGQRPSEGPTKSGITDPVRIA